MSRVVQAEPAASPNRLPMIDTLRGLASLGVALSHYCNTNPDLALPALLQTITSRGWLGVEVFFVISGCVIPLSLYRAGYQAAEFPRFVFKRVLRLDPPYFVSIAVVICLEFLSRRSAQFHGGAFSVSPLQLLAHVGYLNAFLGLGWINSVYWTLAIEFQYYLAIGLFFPLLRRRPFLALGLLVPICLCGAIWPNESFIFQWIPLFIMGILVFFWHIGTIRTAQLVCGLALAFALGIASLGPLRASAGLVAASAIVFIPLKKPLFSTLGTLSYSLYLLHGPIGSRVIHLGMRVRNTPGFGVLTVAVALAVALACAGVMYRLVEKPALEWSRRIRYGRRSATPPAPLITG